MQCPTRDQWIAFHQGSLPITTIDAFSEHLQCCDACTVVVETTRVVSKDSVISQLRQAAEGGTAIPLLEEPEFQQFESFAKKLVHVDDDLTEATGVTESESNTCTPKTIDEFDVIEKIGEGGFARVYLAQNRHDGKRVAIKVPRSDKLTRAGRDLLAAEAETVSSLDHPVIVPVHCVGQTDTGLHYIVMEYVDGESLAVCMRNSPLELQLSVELVATVAEGIHAAHKRGLVHRDLKPANILIDDAGNPRVIDFGLAIQDQTQWDHRGELAGTKPYMAPEQVRREAHRLDGRTDIWGLGVILYELLTGHRPFSGTGEELEDNILRREPKPIRQFDETVSSELESICLKCLAKRMTDRFTNAHDLSTALRQWLNRSKTDDALTTVDTVVVPKGLRSFDADDAGFFLKLLPGPRDQYGLPESLRFWKSRLEAREYDIAFPVGLVYGPSGGGKSSFVKAGLVPRLNTSVVTTLYDEATAIGTESRLKHVLHQRFPESMEAGSLAELLAAIRSGQILPPEKKLLLVFDQFERWLHGTEEFQDSDLVTALRQCDGVRVQALVIVRDDFWMEVTQFFKELECEVIEGRNSLAVDQFGLRHAERVLRMFGRAHGALPELVEHESPDQTKFVKSVVTILSHGKKITGVRLALFAEMTKNWPWTTQTLDRLGGEDGIGVAFLEEKLGANASRKNQRHLHHARQLLDALLPAAGTDIVEHRKSESDLVSECGLATISNSDLQDVLKILDHDLRLVTSVAPDTSGDEPQRRENHYQLTHDFLVPSIRTWLQRKEEETMAGRGRVLLRMRTRRWESDREHRQLPNLVEWLQICVSVKSVEWSKTQRQMMKTAWRKHVSRTIIACSLVGSILLGIRTLIARQDLRHRRREAEMLVEKVMTGPADAVGFGAEVLRPFKKLGIEALQAGFESAEHEAARIHAAGALAILGHPESEYLVEVIANAPEAEGKNIISGLQRNSSAEVLQSILEKANDAEAARDFSLKARYAITALHLGADEIARNMLQLRSDPEQRVAFVNTLPRWHADLDKLAASQIFSDSKLRHALSLGADGIPASQLREDLSKIVQEWVKTEQDAGVRNAMEFAIRKWDIPVPSSSKPFDPNSNQSWYDNSMAMRMIGIPTGKSLDKSFWLCDREVNVRTFRTFMNDEEYDYDKPKEWQGEDVTRSPTNLHPVQRVSWKAAVMFCNWLSWREGLQPYYTKVTESHWNPKTNSNGYRLPKQQEWAHASQCGVDTDYHFGNSSELMPLYGVMESVKLLPCGSKRPNDWGLFDMYGNVYEWCEDISPPKTKGEARHHVLIGGSLESTPHYALLTAATRGQVYRDMYTTGFRVARNRE